MHGSLKTTRDRKTQTTDYTYDIHGRLKNKKIGNNEISYTYDGSGNQLTLTDSTGTTTRTYDELNRTLTKEVPDIGTSTYLYDLTEGIPAGYTKDTTKDPKGNTVAKTYDKTGRLYQGITEEGPTTYAYYDNGNRKSIIYPNGIKEEYTYYKDNCLMTLTNKKADGSIIDTYSYSYGYDAAHNQTVKQDAKGTTEYTYDSLNRLATVQEPGGKKTSYTYDKAGNRLTETVGTQAAATAVTTYTYNEQNRLQSTVTVQGNGLSEKLTYNYDDNGNMVSKFKVKLSLEDPNLQGSFQLFKAGEKENSDVSFYEYDVWNQLVKTTEGTNKISYGYNGEGYRVEKTINGETARYLYEYDKVILEVDGAGAETASNVYGLNLISKKAGNETAYYLYNGHADVTSLIDETGNIVGTYYYDAFGNITEKTGDVKNNITYAGYQYDEETDLYYLNARYYDAKIARFMTEDTYRGSASDPLSLNLYTYVLNNPLMYWDPTGHENVSVTWEGYITDIDDSQLTEYMSHGWSVLTTSNVDNVIKSQEKLGIAGKSNSGKKRSDDYVVDAYSRALENEANYRRHMGEDEMAATAEMVIGIINPQKATNEVDDSILKHGYTIASTQNMSVQFLDGGNNAITLHPGLTAVGVSEAEINNLAMEIVNIVLNSMLFSNTDISSSSAIMAQVSKLAAQSNQKEIPGTLNLASSIKESISTFIENSLRKAATKSMGDFILDSMDELIYDPGVTIEKEIERNMRVTTNQISKLGEYQYLIFDESARNKFVQLIESEINNTSNSVIDVYKEAVNNEILKREIMTLLDKVKEINVNYKKSTQIYYSILESAKKEMEVQFEYETLIELNKFYKEYYGFDLLN